MLDFVSQPWSWYVAGPLIGLLVPVLLIAGGKLFGISSNLRHMCAAIAPGKVEFFQYDWKKSGAWNLTFIFGVAIGGFIASTLMASPDAAVHISEATRGDLGSLGITNFDGMMPVQLFSWPALTTIPGLIMIIGGGFLVGFGARYAGGCTSGHAISGLANLQLPSLIAVIGFFAGGLLVTYVLLPLIL